MLDTRMSIILILASAVLMLSLILLAWIGKSEEIIKDDEIWIKEYNLLLKLTDELLAISMIVWGVGILIILKQFMGKPIAVALSFTCLIVLLSVGANIVVSLGNLVYPVNGLPVIGKSSRFNTIRHIYASLHFFDLIFGTMTIALAFCASQALFLLNGVIVGILQIIFTYYNHQTNAYGYIIAKLAWWLWFMVFIIK